MNISPIVSREHWEAARLTLRAGGWEDSPEGYPQTPPYGWWRWHDDYGTELTEGQREQIARVPDAQGTR